MDLDPVIHEPARLKILAILSGVDRADFKFFLETMGLTKGNLSCHMDRLERAGHVEVLKSFKGKFPYTEYRLTRPGRKALERYWESLDEIRNMEFKSEGSRA